MRCTRKKTQDRVVKMKKVDSVLGMCVHAIAMCAPYLEYFFSSCRTLFSVLFNLFKPLILFFVVIYDNVLCCDIDELETGKDTKWLGWAGWLTTDGEREKIESQRYDFRQRFCQCGVEPIRCLFFLITCTVSW